MSDSRGIGIGAHAGNIIVRLQNKSVVEGVFYVFNATQHSDKFEVYVDDSRLDGRCAFNLWSDGGSVINVTNGSELIGRNPFPGRPRYSRLSWSARRAETGRVLQIT